MDELRTSVQNAAIEQKDPLLVYKLESFQLFQNMLSEINKEVISSLFRARMFGEEEAAHAAKQEIARRDDFSRMKTRHDDIAEIEAKQQARQFATQNQGAERPLSRSERRERERIETKKKK